MKQAFFISWRYQQGKKNHLVALISAFSLFGIALGVAVLIIGLSAMNGFERELNQRILAIVPQTEILGYERGGMPPPIQDFPLLQAKLKENPNVKHSSPFVRFQGLIENGTKLKMVQVRGVDPFTQDKVNQLSHFVENHRWQAFQQQGGIILGAGIAKDLDLHVGDWATLILANPAKMQQPQGKMQKIRVPITGILRLNGQLDHVYVLMPLNDAQQLLGYTRREATGVELSLSQPFLAEQMIYPELTDYPQALAVQSWIQQFGYMYRDIQLIRTVMYLAMVLVMAVACFNIISTLMMTVKDKQRDIAILRTMGASKKFIRHIFIYYGLFVGMKGTLLGILLGSIVAFNLTAIIQGLERLLGYHFLSDGVYFIDFLPSQLQWQDVIMVGVCALVLSLLASLYPAHKACKLPPVRILMNRN